MSENENESTFSEYLIENLKSQGAKGGLVSLVN